jgi:hypothetical protein
LVCPVANGRQLKSRIDGASCNKQHTHGCRGEEAGSGAVLGVVAGLCCSACGPRVVVHPALFMCVHKAASFHARCLAHVCMSVNSVCTQVLAEKGRSLVAPGYIRGDNGLVSPAVTGRQLMVWIDRPLCNKSHTHACLLLNSCCAHRCH